VVERELCEQTNEEASTLCAQEDQGLSACLCKELDLCSRGESAIITLASWMLVFMRTELHYDMWVTPPSRPLPPRLRQG
jgi:hypothetical protein